MSEIINAFISCSIFMLSLYAFGMIIFDEKEEGKRLRNIIFFILGCILHTLIVLYLDNTLKTMSSCLLYIILFKIMFNLGFTKAVFAAIIYAILAIIPELMTTAFIMVILNLGKTFFYEQFIESIIGNVCICAEMILLIVVLKKPLRRLINYDLSANKKIVFISALTIVFVGLFFYKFAVRYEISNDVLIYLLAILAFMVVLFMLFKEKMDSDNFKEKYDELLEVMQTYESDVEEQRTILHETKNEIMTIRCKINDKENDAAILDYIDSILGDKKVKKSNMTKYARFKYLPSNGLKGFFYYKFMEAEKKNISVSVNISPKIEKSFLKKLEVNDFKQLTRIIGVYLDNAIEASSLSKEKKLDIEVYLIENKINIIISNTFTNKIDSDKLGKAKISTKGKNRGHGLLLVKSILSSNDIFESKNEIIDNLFIQKLTIVNKNKKK